ncbi:YlbF family regulator [Romboutsia sp.]|uniref:YlbF family regulator n=1 Tax=Romboutsia sp. TaxID=1965302 RepID=UPI002C5C89C6|nr:YlbF family regulator [Romboutsia sp.]HSQ87943.1 YlbF family regulator [Romboutsia sp.]
MDINQKAKEFAYYIKNTHEFKTMNKAKAELEKNRTLKKQLDNYINKKNTIYSNFRIEDASKKISQLNREYHDFFNLPLVSNYMQATRQFNSMMENLYKSIEKDLLR